MGNEGARTAIVTGGSRGIGRATAIELAAHGYRVLLSYASRKSEAEDTVGKIRSTGGDAFAVQADVRRPGDIDQLFAVAANHFGRLDVLINNAGVGAMAPLEQIDARLVNEAIEVNLQAVILVTQRAVREFGDKGGAVVNVSTALVGQPFPGQAVYTASKAGVEAVTRTLAQELGPRRIRVNAVAPGPTETDLLQVNDEVRGFLASRTALGRIGQPADVARVIAFLASDAAGWITGQVIGVDGGLRL